MPRVVHGTVSRNTTPVLRSMFHVLILNGECTWAHTIRETGNSIYVK